MGPFTAKEIEEAEKDWKSHRDFIQVLRPFLTKRALHEVHEEIEKTGVDSIIPLVEQMHAIFSKQPLKYAITAMEYLTDMYVLNYLKEAEKMGDLEDMKELGDELERTVTDGHEREN